MTASRAVRPLRVWPLLWRWLPLAAWMALIYWLSNQPVLPHPVRQYGISDFLYDSVAHGVTFGLLTLLAYRALPGCGAAPWRWAALWALLYGLSDEGHQSFVPGRTASLADLAMDGAGIAAAVALILVWRRWGPARLRPLVRWLAAHG